MQATALRRLTPASAYGFGIDWTAVPQAQGMMLESFLSINTSSTHFGVVLSREDCKLMMRVPWRTETLRLFGVGHILMGLPGLSILDIRESVKGRGFFPHDDDGFYASRAFASWRPEAPRYHLLSLPVLSGPESTRGMGTAGVHPVFCLMLLRLIEHKPLLPERHWVRCADDIGKGWLYVGYVDGTLHVVKDCADEHHYVLIEREPDVLVN